ncbi:MAG TPA: nucleoside-diphosphate sugar epimerase/dehydratase [Candidatus Aquilonibacter sp.]|nr:nucleoside-diphosphate sugar epimerase/dehydratase [Candidatus Aquilonibacter sp.]
MQYRRVGTVLGAELFLAAISYGAAALVMGVRPKGDGSYTLFAETLGVALLFRLVALLWAGLPQRSLRHATALDLICVTKALAASSLTLAAFLLWCFPGANLSISFFIVDSAFLLILWFGLHFGARVFKTHQAAVPAEGARRTLIIGAGEAGIMLLRELALDSKSPSRPVAILDDDATKWGRTICGLPVKGGTSAIAAVAVELRADEALVCIPSATRGQMRAILDACRRAELPVRTLPPVAELIRQSGAADKSAATVSRGQLRPPRIDDLLDREAIRVDPGETRRLVGGEVVLITGAGGSIGSELSRQVAAAGPRKLLLLDKSENGLFYANLEASEKLGAKCVKPFLADVTDRERIRGLLRAERPAIVFHAAAHKHVAMMDLYPREAIRNNVIGTRNVAEAAVEFGAVRFVNISTDKAVNPRNWMGLSKKLTELCVEELSSRGATLFSNVRFGNVAGSSGSVLRLFWERIERREPIRVTDPRATRFFMSVPEAVHLILRAAAVGQGGETFVFEMGEPVNICELAKTMMLYSGLQPGRDLQIEFTGLQPGEKVEEELWESRERPVDSGSEHILVIRERHPLAQGISRKIGRMEELMARAGEQDLLEYLCMIFPDFHWNRANFTGEAMPVVESAMARSAGAA